MAGKPPEAMVIVVKVKGRNLQVHTKKTKEKTATKKAGRKR
jgi:hypothetical protein